MSKRQEIRERRRRQQIRNRIIAIVIVGLGGLLIAWLFYSSLQNKVTATNATATVVSSNTQPVIAVTPRVFTTKVDGVHLGDPNAPVKVDVYADFRCSACLSYFQNFEPQIIQTYVDTGKVYYSYHFFDVIDSYDNSGASNHAANAALCAGEQGHFWDYHDTLYANQITESADLFTDARLVTMAENLKLNMTEFNQCFQAKKYASVVEADNAEAQSLKLTYTPSILVNGKIVSDFNQLTQTIDAALAGK
jgi:protein-disulfide isomerase